MKDVFKKVHLSDKRKIFKRSTDNQIVWVLKWEEASVQQIVPRKVIDDKIVECDFLKENEFDLKNSEMAVININSEEDKYFFYGLITINSGKVYIDIQGDLYYLQRRKSARLGLPENYSSRCKIIDYKGKQLPFDCEVIDVSSGGCRLSLSSLEPIIKAGTVMRLRITLGHRSPIDVNGEVRHVKPIKDYSDLPQIMGIQFVDYDTGFEARMLNLYMDLQREIFLKYIKKNKDEK